LEILFRFEGGKYIRCVTPLENGVHRNKT
jgi:hypothetical protein